DTALTEALTNNQTKVLQMLLEHGADFKTADNWHNLPLVRAAEMNRVNALKLLLEKEDPLSQTCADALGAAAGNGRTENIKILLEKGVPPDAKGSSGKTALAKACESGQTEAVKLLAEKGADMNLADKNGISPLMAAVLRGKTETARFLLKNRSSGTDLSQILKSVIRTGNGNMAELLIGEGADPNAADEETGRTFLLMACETGNTEMVRLFLQKGADVNAAEKRSGTTPLMVAAQRGNAELVRLLLEKGADKKVRNQLGFTASDMAANEQIREILAKGTVEK
ncbi:MAG: ankyrin repeat domain-containing protein, partial [Desulfobacterales bacterium]